MAEIGFDTEWLNGDSIRGAELSATFASLRINVQGQAVTRVLDHRARTVRDFVDVPLYPLAEWLAANWWFLAYEFENAAKKEDPDFVRRHALGANTEGYAFPNLMAIPAGSRTSLTWGGAPSPWTRVEFLDQGYEFIDREAFRQTCADLIDRVVRRLAAFDVHDTFLQEEWAAIQGADDEELSFCETAAGLGWDPYDLDEARREQVFRLADELGPLCSEAVPVMDSADPLRDSSAIVSALEAAKPNSLQLRSLRTLMEDKSPSTGYPWEAGYDLARQARKHLDLDGQPIPDMQSLAEALGEDIKTLTQATLPVAPLSMVRLIDAVVTGGERGAVSFGLRRAGEDGQRFLFCRALAETISSDGDALITRAHTERQQRNRAFAAEFLAPAHSLRERVSRYVMDNEEVEYLAEEFGVSTQVIVRQIENHKIAQLV